MDNVICIRDRMNIIIIIIIIIIEEEENLSR
jgi:hypothetical protein